MIINTEFNYKFLSGKSCSDNNSSQLLSGDFDLLVLASSWDRRCTSITECNDVRSEDSIFLYFKTRDNLGLRDKHDQIIIEYANTVSKNETRKIVGESVAVEHYWSLLSTEMQRIFTERGRPLSILLDLSTCPRYYALAILASCLLKGLAYKFTIFYAEGIYESNRKKEEMLDFAFTKGKWRSIAIPSLEGTCDPVKNKYFMVSVGFEGEKTIRAVHKEDPDRISLLFPDPGIIPEYVEIAKKKNKDLIDEYKVPSNQIVRIHASDAIGAWRALTEANLERINENVHYLLCGTKPHAMGMALRALSLGYPSVLYNIPEGHSITDIYPSGVYWKFEISDLSSPLL